MSDLHGKWSYGIDNPIDFTELINKVGYDAVFMRYKLVYGTPHPPDVVWSNLKPTTYFVPWSVDDRLFKPSQTKTVDVASIGSIMDCYPLRKLINENLYSICHRAKKKTLLRFAPRGKTFERKISELSREYLVGKDYAKALGDTRIFITGCSVYRYPLQKFFQATASGCMLLSNEPSTAKELGFINNKTYFMIKGNTWESSLKYFLDNPQDMRRIARGGLKNTLMNHTHDTRAKEFIKILSS